MKIGLLMDVSLTTFRLETLKPILSSSAFNVEIAIIDDTPKKTRLQKLKKNLKRGRGGYVVVMAIEKVFKRKEYSVSSIEFCRINSIPAFLTRNLYSDKTLNIIRDSRLDVLLLIGGFGIIKEPLLSLTPLGIISYHHGDMRKYRGMPPGFWELYYGESSMGVTVQKLSAGLDCGFPIEERTIPINKLDTLSELQKRAKLESTDLMYLSLKKLEKINYVPQKLEHYGKVFTLPNFRQWIILNFKIGLRWFLSIFK